MDDNCVRLKIRNKFLKNKKSTSWGYLADFPGGSDDVCIPPKEFLLEPFEQKIHSSHQISSSFNLYVEFWVSTDVFNFPK